MNTNRVLVAELFISLGFSSWAALKSRQLPWPPTIVYTSAAFGILGAASFLAPELAVTLGGGFLLAQLIKVLSNKAPYTGGVPALDGTPSTTANIKNSSSKTGTSNWRVNTF